MTSPSLPPPPPAPPRAPGSAATTPAPSPQAVPGGPWGARRALVGIPLLLVVAAIEAAVVSVFDPNLKALGAKLALQGLLAITLAAVAFLLAGTEGRPAEPAALGLRRPRTPIRFALAGYVAYFAFAIAYASAVHPHQKDITRSLGYGHGLVASVAVGLLIVVAAPASEEIFFRGFLFGGLRRRLPFVIAAIVSAAIFGAFHYTGSGSLTVLPQLAFLGLAQAWIYERSGSIYPTIAVHMVNNALAFALITS